MVKLVWKAFRATSPPFHQLVTNFTNFTNFTNLSPTFRQPFTNLSPTFHHLHQLFTNFTNFSPTSPTCHHLHQPFSNFTTLSSLPPTLVICNQLLLIVECLVFLMLFVYSMLLPSLYLLGVFGAFLLIKLALTYDGCSHQSLGFAMMDLAMTNIEERRRRREELLLTLHMIAHERLCCVCWGGVLTSFLDQMLGLSIIAESPSLWFLCVVDYKLAQFNTDTKHVCWNMDLWWNYVESQWSTRWHRHILLHKHDVLNIFHFCIRIYSFTCIHMYM